MDPQVSTLFKVKRYIGTWILGVEHFGAPRVASARK